MADEAATPAATSGESSTPAAEATAVPAPAPDLSDDDIIAELHAKAKSDESDRLAQKGEKARAKGGKKKDAPKATEEEPAEPEGEEPAPATTGAAALGYESADQALAAVLEAFESGDPKKLSAATGKPVSFFQAGDDKWNALRAGMADVKRGKSEVRNGFAKLEEGRQRAIAEFGPAIRARQAFESGDMAAFVEIVSTFAGVPYDEAQRQVIEGELAADGPTKAMRKKMREMEQEIARLKTEPAKPKEPSPEDRQAALQRVHQTIRSELAGHAVAKIRGFEGLIVDRVRDSWDATEQTYTMSYQEAADAIAEERSAEAEALLTARGRKIEKPAPAVKPPVVSKGRAADARGSRPRWETDDLDDDEIIESIHADMKSGRLK
jgi:hypothetical protein